MNSKRLIFWLLATAVLFFAAVAFAQDTSQTSVSQSGPSVKTSTVEKGEIIYVSGNELVVKMDNGEVRHLTVPPDAYAIVDGKKVTIKDAKVGMHLQKTITVTRTPEVITTVRTIQGKVWNVNAPKTVILTLPDGTNKQYNVPKDQKFMIEGREATVFELKKGMNVTATVLTQVPQDVASHEQKVTGKMPTPPELPAMSGPLLIETASAAKPLPSMAAESTAPTKLPKTGSILPALGMLGMMAIAGSLTMKWAMRRR